MPLEVALLADQATQFYHLSATIQRLTILTALYHNFGNNNGYYSRTVDVSNSVTGFITQAEKDHSITREEIVEVCDLIANIKDDRAQQCHPLVRDIIKDSITLNVSHKNGNTVNQNVPLLTSWGRNVMGRLL